MVLSDRDGRSQVAQYDSISDSVMAILPEPSILICEDFTTILLKYVLLVPLVTSNAYDLGSCWALAPFLPTD